MHLWVGYDLSRVALRLTWIGIYQILDVLHLNDGWGWLNGLGLTFILVIVWNEKILTQFSIVTVTTRME